LGYSTLKVIENGTICGFLFALYSNDGRFLYNLRDKVAYWLKIAIYSYPPAFSARVRGVPVGIMPYRLEWKSYRMVWLTDSEKIR